MYSIEVYQDNAWHTKGKPLPTMLQAIRQIKLYRRARIMHNGACVYYQTA